MADIVREIIDAQSNGMFMVLTGNQVKAFATVDECEEQAAALGGQQFAVVRLLWTGGTQVLEDWEAAERKRLESEANARRASMPVRGTEAEPITISVEHAPAPPETVYRVTVLEPKPKEPPKRKKQRGSEAS